MAEVDLGALDPDAARGYLGVLDDPDPDLKFGPGTPAGLATHRWLRLTDELCDHGEADPYEVAARLVVAFAEGQPGDLLVHDGRRPRGAEARPPLRRGRRRRLLSDGVAPRRDLRRRGEVGHRGRAPGVGDLQGAAPP